MKTCNCLSVGLRCTDLCNCVNCENAADDDNENNDISSSESSDDENELSSSDEYSSESDCDTGIEDDV